MIAAKRNWSVKTAYATTRVINAVDERTDRHLFLSVVIVYQETCRIVLKRCMEKMKCVSDSRMARRKDVFKNHAANAATAIRHVEQVARRERLVPKHSFWLRNSRALRVEIPRKAVAYLTPHAKPQSTWHEDMNLARRSTW